MHCSYLLTVVGITSVELSLNIKGCRGIYVVYGQTIFVTG